MTRSNCEKCKGLGHLIVNGSYTRCECLELEINKKQLGPMFSDRPAKTTTLLKYLEEDVVVEGVLNEVRRHLSRVLLNQIRDKKTYSILDAYRLIDIYLDKDTELDNSYSFIESDFLVIMLGFGDPPNRMLPELVIQVLSRRELMSKPTWVVLGLSFERISTKYNVELQSRLERFKRVNCK